MKTNILVTTGAIVVLAAAALTIVHTVRSKQEAEDALAVTARKQAALEDELQRQNNRLLSAEESRAALQTSVGTAAAAKPKSPERPSEKASPGAALPNPRELLTNDPQLQTLWLKSGRSAVQRQYGLLFETLQLSPAQIAKFQDNVIRQQEQLMDLAGVAQSQGAEAKQAIDTLRAKANDEFQAAQSELLGSDGIKRWRDYERSAQVRSVVEGFAGTAVLNGFPITAEQGNRLAETLAGATQDYGSGGRAEAATIDWASLDARLQQILSPPQLTLFKTAAPLGNTWSRWTTEMESAIRTAQQADAKNPSATAAKVPGT